MIINSVVLIKILDLIKNFHPWRFEYKKYNKTFFWRFSKKIQFQRNIIGNLFMNKSLFSDSSQENFGTFGKQTKSNFNGRKSEQFQKKKIYESS